MKVKKGKRKKFKRLLWQFGLIERCPDCGGELMKTGYSKDFYQYFKCLNCGFGNEKQ